MTDIPTLVELLQNNSPTLRLVAPKQYVLEVVVDSLSGVGKFHFPTEASDLAIAFLCIATDRDCKLAVKTTGG